MAMPLHSVSATDMKNRFGDYLGEIIHRGTAILVEKHGKPVAVMLSIGEWSRLQEEQRRTDSPWIAACKKLADSIRKKHPRGWHTPTVSLVKRVREEET